MALTAIGAFYGFKEITKTDNGTEAEESAVREAMDKIEIGGEAYY